MLRFGIHEQKTIVYGIHEQKTIVYGCIDCMGIFSSNEIHYTMTDKKMCPNCGSTDSLKLYSTCASIGDILIDLKSGGKV